MPKPPTPPPFNVLMNIALITLRTSTFLIFSLSLPVIISIVLRRLIHPRGLSCAPFSGVFLVCLLKPLPGNTHPVASLPVVERLIFLYEQNVRLVLSIVLLRSLRYLHFVSSATRESVPRTLNACMLFLQHGRRWRSR